MEDKQPARMEERRRSRRARISLPHVVFASLLSRSDAPLVVRVLDASIGGVKVLVPPSYEQLWPELGRKEMALAVNFDGADVLSCTARVVWLGGTIITGHRSNFSGLAIAGLAEQDQRWLKTYIEEIMAG